jgi:CubicO group peptidase (beta-lactamase class C family)
MIEFMDKHIYALNNIDDDILDEHSEFPIGSVTKLFTIVSLLLLHQNKQLDIYDTIGKYIDNNNIKNLIIIDIMNHISGLKNIFDGSSKIEYDSATEIYNKWNNGNLLDKKSLGTHSYSNVGYIILGALIEKIF